MFGLLEMPAGLAPAVGVVLLKPFGQEALRTHRILRILGERLAQAGFAVLRFDAFATGDSDGDDGEASLAAWVDDVALADAELRRLAAVGRTFWIGARLGASIALLAARDADPRPERIVAWEPILDGRAYLDELQAAQCRALRAGAVGFAETLRLARHPAQPAVAPEEALGFPLPPALAGALRALDAGSFRNLGNLGLDVFLDAVPDPSGALAGSPFSGGASARVNRLDTRLDWLIDESDDFPAVPAATVQAIVSRVTEAA